MPPSHALRPSRRRGIAAWLALSLVLAGCATKIVPRTTVTPVRSGTINDPLSLAFEYPQKRAPRSADIPEIDGLRLLLFQGVPGTPVGRQLIPIGVDTAGIHRATFARMLSADGHRRYVMQATGPVKTGDVVTWTITYNLGVLRRDLEASNVVPRMGLP